MLKYNLSNRKNEPNIFSLAPFDTIKIFNEKRLFAMRETLSVKWLKFS